MDYLLIFVEGIASFISPCILPMLPLYISYFAGQDKKASSAVKNVIGFILGFTVVFVLLGAFSSTIGRVVKFNMKYINILFGSIVILFGLHYMGILNIKLLNKSFGSTRVKKNDLSFFSAILFGIIFSTCWTPCVGVFLSAALAMSATVDSIIKGMIMLFLYSMGLGVPFIITAIFLEKLKTTFDFIKKHYLTINRICGTILIVSGIIIMF